MDLFLQAQFQEPVLKSELEEPGTAYVLGLGFRVVWLGVFAFWIAAVYPGERPAN